MTTGRTAATIALAPVLVARGWKARAAGWFTKEIWPGVTGVLAVSVASEHHAAGSASVTIMVGLRDQATEDIVEQVMGPSTPRYAGRTWVTPLGYLLASPAYREGEREFNERNASEQAVELADLVTGQVEPRLLRVGVDLTELATLTEASTSSMGATGLCRMATLVAKRQGRSAASEYVSKRLEALDDRTDPAANLEREVAPNVMAALAAR